MPIYEFKCQSCDHPSEVMRSLSDNGHPVPFAAAGTSGDKPACKACD